MANAFPLNDLLVYLPGRYVMVTGKCSQKITLVVTEVEIHFAAVICHVYFAVSESISAQYQSVEFGICILTQLATWSPHRY